MRAARSTPWCFPPDVRWELSKLRATVAWELAEVAQSHPASTGGKQPADLALSAYALLDAAVRRCSDAAADAGLDASRRAEAYQRLASQRLELADLCDRAWSMGRTQLELRSRQADFVATGQEQVLRAMQAGSTEACNRLPSILALSRDQPALWPTLRAQLQLPPKWMYLGWASQLLAMLNEPHGACVAELLTQLSELYPRALYFAFQVAHPP